MNIYTKPSGKGQQISESAADSYENEFHTSYYSSTLYVTSLKLFNGTDR
jgi:hypothetical protein